MRKVDTDNWDSLTSLVSQVFGEVLGIHDISENDDFYDDCAGSSIQAWSVIVTLETVFDVELKFAAFLLDRTPRGVAGLLLGATLRESHNHERSDVSPLDRATAPPYDTSG